MVLQKKGRNVVVNRIAASALADLLSPRFCVQCETRLEVAEKFLCEECTGKIPVLNEEELSRICNDHFPQGEIDKMISIAEFAELSPLRILIHSLKYFDHFETGKYLGSLLGKLQKPLFQKLQIDMIIPVPLHKLRLVERGYNQSLEIAKGLAGVISVPVESGTVTRFKATHQQVASVNRHERELNMKGAFRVDHPLRVAGKNLLVVDDVITTGSTVRTLADELMRSGASSVHAASILVVFSHFFGG